MKLLTMYLCVILYDSRKHRKWQTLYSTSYSNGYQSIEIPLVIPHCRWVAPLSKQNRRFHSPLLQLSRVHLRESGMVQNSVTSAPVCVYFHPITTYLWHFPLRILYGIRTIMSHHFWLSEVFASVWWPYGKRVVQIEYLLYNVEHVQTQICHLLCRHSRVWLSPLWI